MSINHDDPVGHAREEILNTLRSLLGVKHNDEIVPTIRAALEAVAKRNVLAKKVADAAWAFSQHAPAFCGRDGVARFEAPIAPLNELIRARTKLDEFLSAGAIQGHPADVEVTTSRQKEVPDPAECLWRDDEGVWNGSCGVAWRFDDGGVAENDVRFCLRCGKPVRVEEAAEEEEAPCP